MCDEKLPFFALAQALSQRKLPHTGLQVEANSTSLVLKLLTLPMPEAKPEIKVCIVSIRISHFEVKSFILFIYLFDFNVYSMNFCRSYFQPSIQTFGMY